MTSLRAIRRPGLRWAVTRLILAAARSVS
jgi:hypothetical protein